MKFNSIEAMEEFAMGEQDGSANAKIRGEWLEVAYLGEGVFHYNWGKNRVSKKVAINILASQDTVERPTQDTVERPTRLIILRARVVVEISATDLHAKTEAIAELRRTLEKEGYTPSIDYRGEANG